MQPNHMNMPYNQSQVSPEMMDQQHHAQQMHDTCCQFHLYFIQLQTDDGQMHEGIIEDVDQNGVTVLTPTGDEEDINTLTNPHHMNNNYNNNDDNNRQFGPYGGYGGYGGYPPYGYGFPRRFRRFRRRRFPFFRLHRLFFPYFY